MGSIRVPSGAGFDITIREPERGDFDRNLNGALQYTLSHFIYKLLDIMGEGLGRFAGSFLVHTLDHIAPELVQSVGPFLDDLLANPDLPPGFRQMLEKARAASGQGDAGLLGLLGGTAGGAAVGSIINSMMSPATYWINRQLHPARTSPGESYAMMWRGGMDPATVRDYLEDVGYAESVIAGFEEIVRPRVGAPDLLSGMWRGLYDWGYVQSELEKRGYNSENIAVVQELANLIPSPGDLITMAVREAWRDDVAAKYGLDQDWVADFGFWMQKQGFSEEWAKKWWRAHWRLPGLAQAREMLWRTDMTEGDFKEFLRFADMPETWRQWQTEIAYRTLTRVDIRRMHKMGELLDEDLVTEYSNFGYNLENAERMARFTIAYNTNDDREVSKTDLLKGYNLEVLEPKEAWDALIAIGYSEAQATYYLTVEDYKKANQLAEEQISVIRDLYISGELDKGEATGRLGAIGVTAGRMARLFELWDVRREARTRRPTKADLERFVKQDIITAPAYSDQMERSGYSAEYVQMYYASIVLDVEEEARKEEERAAKEAERVRALEVKTVYQSQKAQLDFHIAQERLHFQQIKTAVTLYARREEVDELMATIVELQEQIATIQVEIAGKRTAIREAGAALRELEVPPDLSVLYDAIDEINLQITERQSAVADLRVTIAEAQAAIRVARLPPAAAELTQTISDAQAQIALEQSIIADLQVSIAQSRLGIARLEIPVEVQQLYAIVDQANIEITQQRFTIAELRVILTETQIAAAWEAPAADVEAQRRIIDALEIEVRVEQEDIARVKLEIAEIRAQVERMLSSEEISELEAELEASRERVRELEVDRARLRLPE